MSSYTGDFMRAMLTKELTTDEVDTKTGKIVNVKLAGTVAVKLSEQEQAASVQLPETVQALVNLGYDLDSDLVKSVTATNTRLRETLTKISANLEKHTA